MNRWNRFKNWVRDKWLPKVRFKSFAGNFSVATPVVSSVRIRPKWLKEQKTKMKFPHCPGMFDFMNAGYIITAHTDIHIKANDAGCVVVVEGMHVDNEDVNKLKPSQFKFDIIQGMIHPDPSVEKTAWKIPLPWSIHMRKGYSGYLLPAYFHSDFLDKIWVMPGVVHYDNYHTSNFVFVPLKECEFTIPAGTPLLQFIPVRREDFDAECGRTTERERDEQFYNMPSRVLGYYRKFLAGRQKFKMSCPYDHRD